MKKIAVIEVEGQQYDVFEDGNGRSVSIGKDSEDTLGIAYLGAHKIVIHKDLKEAAKHKVLMHELTHVYIEENVVYRDVYDEETVCDIVAAFGAEIAALATIVYPCEERQIHAGVCLIDQQEADEDTGVPVFQSGLAYL